MKRQESGFAMLLVMAAAAAAAWMLYMELPRLAFENQRTKEEMLVERGEQYIRGVELFVRKNKKYPQSMEELEQTNGIRFLRRRYNDPMTGKDDWRLIHANASGQLTDSLVQSADASNSGSSSNSNQNPYSPGAAPVTDAAAAAAGGPRRASEMPGAAGAMPPPGSTPPVPEGLQPGAAPIPPAPGAPGFQQMPQVPGAPGTQQMAPVPGAPGSANTSTGYAIGNNYTIGNYVPPTPGGNSPQTPVAPTAPIGGMPGGVAGSSGGASSPAADMIRKLLTTPNPQAMQNVINQQKQGQAGFGAGIVGVASKVDREGIKIYNERTNYKEWEFIFDPQKQGGATGAPGQNGTPSATPKRTQ